GNSLHGSRQASMSRQKRLENLFIHCASHLLMLLVWHLLFAANGCDRQNAERLHTGQQTF
ncbi:hypothetical protein, partial [Klebsiella pneumoniae]|uniref:hypothetical protein n=1 Tax=Klebsiella pneumoniae TaxID=573 RepID=UPI0025A01EA6